MENFPLLTIFRKKIGKMKKLPIADPEVINDNILPSDSNPNIHSDLNRPSTVSTSHVSRSPTGNPAFTKNTNEPSLGIKFLSAGMAACFADIVTFPLDTAKVRLQIQGERPLPNNSVSKPPLSYTYNFPGKGFYYQRYHGIYGTIKTICKEEGVRSLYNGLFAGLQRQMCFASVRIGLYESTKYFYSNMLGNNKENNPNILSQILAAITTGSLAIACAQPTDVVKVRLQAQMKHSCRYTGSLHAYQSIIADEGLRGLWKGIVPNMSRNAVFNTTELVSYDIIKYAILQRKLLSDNAPCHFISGFGAGFSTTVAGLPIDVIKTRYINAKPGVYRGAYHCAASMYNEAGMKTFYKGFMPCFVRLGAWNIVMFMTYEHLKQMFTRKHPVTRGKPTAELDLSV